MKSDKFNRKLRRFLAASLGASCVSTMMVNAMENQHQNPIQNRNIQEGLLNFNQETRQALWDGIKSQDRGDIPIESDNITYSFNVANPITDSNSYSFCWLSCNDKPEIKFIMLNLNGGTLLIIPCYKAIDAPKIAEEISKYFEENTNQIVADFEQDCWANKDNIKSYIASLNQENNENEIENDESPSTFQKFKGFIEKQSSENKFKLLLAAAPGLIALVTMILQRLLR